MVRCTAKITHLWSVLWIIFSCSSFEPYDSLSSQMCPAVKKSIDSYWGVCVFPSPVLICSVTSDRTKVPLWLTLWLWNGVTTAQRVQWRFLEQGSRVSFLLSSSSSRLETFASFGHPALAHLGQCFFWRACGTLRSAPCGQGRELCCMPCTDSPGCCQALVKLSWAGISQHKTCYRANQDLCLYYHCKLEPNL